MSDEIRRLALDVLEVEARAVRDVARAVDERFMGAVEAIIRCTTEGAAVVTCGVGKAGHIARKLSATLSSTGTPSHFLSPADAVHGDLGSVRGGNRQRAAGGASVGERTGGDVVILLSSSGESEEIVRILSLLKKLGNVVIGVTASAKSSLGRHADFVIEMGKISEACPLGLAPTASTTAMLAICDALALCVMQRRNFGAEDFALFHPAGQLGRKLMTVREAMTFRVGENLPVYGEGMSVIDMLHERAKIQRPPGAVVVVDAGGRLSGIVTDGDLRRLFTDVADGNGAAEALKKPLGAIMKRGPKHILAEALASEAMGIMRPLRIDELPVVDGEGRPVGMIDVQDLVMLKMLDVSEG